MPIVTLKEEMAREFFMRRPWLHGDAADDLISEDDYQSLKIRDGRFWKSIDERRRVYLQGFIDGWKSSKQ